MRLKAMLAVASSVVVAVLLLLVLAGTAGAAGTTLTIPAGDVATLSNAHWGGTDQCPVDSLAYGYALGGGSNNQVATGNGCNTAAGATIGPFASSMTLTVYLADNSCAEDPPTYYSDGTGNANHALVTAEGTGKWEVSLMDCDGGSETSSTRIPTANGDGNLNVTVTLSSPPVYQSGASLNGDAQQGETLTADAGTWTGTPAPTFSYDWKRCDSSNSCANIGSGPVTSGDTSSSSYQLTNADVGDTIEVLISASNGVSGGSGAQTVGPSATVVPPVPQEQSPPSVPGTPKQGVPVTADEGTWSNNPSSFDFLWLTCTSPGSCAPSTGGGAATQTYTPDAADVGNTLEVQVTAHNAGGPGVATSGPSATVVPPDPTVQTAPSVPGTPQQGVPVTADEGTWSNNPSSFDFLWLMCT
ncbi:MAG TPA: hypothetical protein VHX66_13775, partial [Solirubrobacteraceae bacterium]|nr:hypothetical protein [Solirubrobacteraceae bacterium]